MPFKIHLLIIAMIVVVVYFIQLTLSKIPDAPSPEVAQTAQDARFNISITHASWGLNCRNQYRPQQSNAVDSAFKGAESDKIHEDNALAKISELCNGQKQCDVTVDAPTLGDDPDPTCGGKTLVVEYRCFSYDRPRSIEVPTDGTLSINCSHSGN